VIYFCDRSMGRRLPIAMSLMGVDVEIHDSHFDESTQDDTWLAHCGRSRWIALSFDRLRFLRGAAGREAIIQNRAGCFVFKAASKNSWERMQIVAKAWKAIEDHALFTPCPFLVQVDKSGKLTPIYPVPQQVSRRGG
jgi:hypothetical protein